MKYAELISEFVYSLAESGSIKWWWLDDVLESVSEEGEVPPDELFNASMNFIMGLEPDLLTDEQLELWLRIVDELIELGSDDSENLEIEEQWLSVRWNKYLKESTVYGDVESNDDESDKIYRNHFYYSRGWLPKSLVSLLSPESQEKWRTMTKEISGASSIYRGQYFNKGESISTTDIEKSTSRIGNGLFRRTLSKSVSAMNDGFGYANKSSVHHRQRAKKWFRRKKSSILLKRKQFRKKVKHRLELKKRKQAEKRGRTLTGRRKRQYHT